MLFLGGWLPDDITKTTEQITVDPPAVRGGPLLPEYFLRHCSVLVDDKVFLIGGGVDTENKLLMIDVGTSAMTYKSELIHECYDHACAQITGSNGKKQIVVSGGFGLKSTEIYDIDMDKWQEGKITSKIALTYCCEPK